MGLVGDLFQKDPLLFLNAKTFVQWLLSRQYTSYVQSLSQQNQKSRNQYWHVWSHAKQKDEKIIEKLKRQYTCTEEFNGKPICLRKLQPTVSHWIWLFSLPSSLLISWCFPSPQENWRPSHMYKTLALFVPELPSESYVRYTDVESRLLKGCSTLSKVGHW